MAAQRPETGRCGACKISRQHGFVWCQLHYASPPPALICRVAWKKPFPARTAMREVKVLMDISTAIGAEYAPISPNAACAQISDTFSDSLWNLKSEQPERFASWSTIRWMGDDDSASALLRI